MEFPVEYYFKWQTVAFFDGYDEVFLGRYPYRLETKAVFEEGDTYISLWDLGRIYSPYLTWGENKGNVNLSFGNAHKDTAVLRAGEKKALLNGEEVELPLPVKTIEGKVFVPFFGVMTKLFGKYKVDTDSPRPLRTPIMVLSDDKDFAYDSRQFRPLLSALRHQTMGNIRRLYFNDRIEHLLPYRVFMPCGYEGKKLPGVIVLHGGGSDIEKPFETAGGRLEELAQEKGFILIGVDGGILDSWYGCLIPNASTLDTLKPELVEDPANPAGISSKRVWQRTESGKAAMDTIERALGEFPIDRERLFIMGNSMGSGGTFHMVSQNPGMFKGAAPSGGMYNTNFFPMEKLKGTPIFFAFGTDDEYGPDYLTRACTAMKEVHVDIRLCPVGGHGHGDAWVHALDKIFAFFEEQL